MHCNANGAGSTVVGEVTFVAVNLESYCIVEGPVCTRCIDESLQNTVYSYMLYYCRGVVLSDYDRV